MKILLLLTSLTIVSCSPPPPPPQVSFFAGRDKHTSTIPEYIRNISYKIPSADPLNKHEEHITLQTIENKLLSCDWSINADRKFDNSIDATLEIHFIEHRDRGIAYAKFINLKFNTIMWKRQIEYIIPHYEESWGMIFRKPVAPPRPPYRKIAESLLKDLPVRQ